MRDALDRTDRTLALVSAAYLASPYCTDEWTGAFLHDPDGRNRLLQVWMEECELPRLLRAQVYIDLASLPREQARARLLAEVKRGRRKPAGEPPFPHDRREGPRFPGHGLEVTNLPPRNPDFAGRTAFLEELHATLAGGGQAAVVQVAAVHGLGGVGKTQLALEYAHRYAADYDLIWWVPSEQPVAIPGLLAGLAKRLGIPSRPTRRSCCPACGTSCDSGTAGLWSMTTPQAPGSWHPTGHRAVPAGCWSPLGRQLGSGRRLQCG